jgi:hypothetical protein
MAKLGEDVTDIQSGLAVGGHGTGLPAGGTAEHVPIGHGEPLEPPRWDHNLRRRILGRPSIAFLLTAIAGVLSAVQS